MQRVHETQAKLLEVLHRRPRGSDQIRLYVQIAMPVSCSSYFGGSILNNNHKSNTTGILASSSPKPVYFLVHDGQDMSWMSNIL